MKKNYALLFFLLMISFANAQIVAIPDSSFKAKLLQADVTNTIAKDANDNNIKIDSNNNGEIEVSEAQLVYKLFTPTNTGPPPFKMSSGSATTQSTALISDLTGIAAFSNLSHLYLLNCTLPTLDLSANTALKYLYAPSNEITAITLTGLSQLETLDIRSNHLTSFATTGLTGLKTLNCQNNDLTFLEINNSLLLTNVDCFQNALTVLDVSNLNALISLNCSDNQLTTLDVTACSQLMTLKCGNNALTSLNINNPSLQRLECNNNALTALNLNPAPALKYLDFHHNFLTNLDITTNNSLQSLNCDSNLLTSLDIAANQNLTNLSCSNNAISTLSFNHPLLTGVSCSNTLIAQLDASHSGIYTLIANNNPNLTYFNVKNGVITPDVYVSQFPEPPYTRDNFQMTNCPLLQYICHDEGEFGSLLVAHQNLAMISRGTYCTFAPGGSYNTVEGNVALDCGGSAVLFSQQKLAITSDSQTGYTFTNADGDFTFYNGLGAVTVAPVLENPAYFSVTPANHTFNFTTAGNTETADFCLTATGVHPDLDIVLVPLNAARPGFDAHYKLIFKNKGNQTQSGSVTLEYQDAVLDLVSAIPAITLQSGNSLSWDFTGLAPFETRSITVSFNLNSPMETPPVNNGDVLHYQAAIVSNLTDETPNDNVVALPQMVVGSFDPNDKMVVQGSEVGMDKVGEYLHYVVRFQNTGTAPAENVVISDMLDANLDWSSLEMVAASHAFRSTLTEGNKLEVFFENIALPASSADELGSHGYIAYKVKPKTTVGIDDTISNTAGIYFDFNFPIITNTVTTTFRALGISGQTQNSLFRVYPNPANEVVHLSISHNALVKSVKIENIMGQTILETTATENIAISHLTKGTYLISVLTDRGKATQKFIKL